MRFLVTDESVRLARWLRLLGYDTVVVPWQPLSQLCTRAYNEQRVVVTRNTKVAGGCLFRVVHLSSGALEEQLPQLIHALRLSIPEESIGSRCNCCNAELKIVAKPSIQDQVPPHVFQTQRRFLACPSCHRIYWAATHDQRIRRFLEQVTR